MISPAKRISTVQEYYFSKKLREIAARNAAGEDIINLGIGSPDGQPAQSVIEQLAKTASNTDSHGYQSYKGIPALRQEFSNWYKKNYQVNLDPETEILPLIGSKEGIMHISMTYLEAGDQVLIPNPGYPAYAAAANLAGAEILHYDLSAANGWMPDFDQLKTQDLSKVKLMWVNYPHMPTGAVASADVMDEIVRFGEQNNILICNDNPYSFILNDKPQSILQGLSDKTNVIELNSLSKSHNMAGWRIGMLASHEQHIQNIMKFKSNMDSGMFLALQEAAVEALKQGEEWFDSLNKEYKLRQQIAFQLLDVLSCAYDPKQVGLFVWGKAPDHIESVEEWLDSIIDECQVFLTPGFIFGSNGERYVRISLCSTQEILNKSLNRIQNKTNKL